MPFYVKHGSIPGKRHVQHRRESGAHTYEEHVSREGFSDIYSNVYHLRMPTRVTKVGRFLPHAPRVADDPVHRHRHLRTFQLPAGGDWVRGRRPLAFNADVTLGVAAPAEGADFHYRNAMADEVLFVHHGRGALESTFGRLVFGPGDYIVIPRGVTHRIEFNGDGENRLFVIEAAGPVDTPSHYRNKYGQLLEHAPYCERDIRVPEFVPPRDEEGEFPILVRLDRGWQEYVLGQHPFDAVGWDGFYYPWIFNIRDYMPKVGKVHLPPPTHLTFRGRNFVICSFVPRLFDFHPDAIPIPYSHSNVDSDEVIYYVEGNFMSRRGIERGSITLHPFGLPHGPQPGLMEAAIGQKETEELAVMVDTFRPLTVTADALEADDPSYPLSWVP
jgi:homogentisate 1,2-dioxygenase